MTIEKEHLKRCDLLRLSGRFDSAAAPELEKAFRESLDEGTYRIAVDMDGVEFFGSAAIRVLIMAYKECRRWNRGDVRLASVPDRVAHVLELAGILELIQTYDEPVLAVGSF